MSSTPSSKSKSHKKRKVSAADIKKENASLRKSGAKKACPSTSILSQDPTKSLSSSLSQATKKSIVPANFDLLSPKQKAFQSVGANNIIMAIRTLPEMPLDMVSSISKMIINNFGINYRRKSPTTFAKSTRSNSTKSSSNIIQNSDNNSFDFPSHSFRRCLVEDFMITEVGTEVMILFHFILLILSQYELIIYEGLYSSPTNFTDSLPFPSFSSIFNCNISAAIN